MLQIEVRKIEIKALVFQPPSGEMIANQYFVNVHM